MAIKTDRLGKTKMMSCGMEATIIRYNNAHDIDVRFKDGTVVEHREYGNFKKGGITNPNFNPRLGETNMMNCGMEATIIRYGNSKDIDVRFEDRTIAKCKMYGEFKRGNIAHPSTTAKARLGETRMMNCGMEATIIRYNTSKDIDVRFEDGAIAECKGYKEFKKGSIANPYIKASRLGETRMMNCGMKATIIRYGGVRDIEVRFKDGTVVKNRRYSALKKGEIANPDIKTSAENCLGKTKMMSCGMKATIIRYGGCNDIDVRFEDGAIVEHKTYTSFKKSGIANPDIKTSAENCLGKTKMMSCGMKATIIRYGACADIDIRFEDRAVVEHKRYSSFEKGEIAHPSLQLSHGSKDFHGFICKQGFKDEDRTLYECICKHCGLEDVLTPQEMMEHEKLQHGNN